MGWHRGMNIITDGLVSYYDTMNTKCFKTYNLLQYTEDFGNTIWEKIVGISVTNNIAIAPDGTLTADKLTESNDINSQYMPQIYNNSDGIYTFSYYAKAAERNICSIIIADANSGSNGGNANFDLINGVVLLSSAFGTGAKPIATISGIGNGWYRCSLTITLSGFTNYRYYIRLNTTPASPGNYQGIPGYGIYIWGAQLTRGKRTLPYQPVLTTPSPIITDLITKKNGILTNNPIFNAGDGEIIFNGIDNYIDTDFIGSNTDSYTVDVWCYVTSGNPFMRGNDSFGGWSCTMALTGFHVVVNGSLYGTSYVPISTNRWVNLVGVYSRDTGSLRFYLNGSFNGAGTCPVNGTLRNSTKGFLLANANSAYFNGKLGAFRVYNRVLSPDEILQNYKSTKSKYL